jgi:hypothetical protein
MLDQSHNVTDPIESLMSSAVEVQRAFVQSANLVDRAAWPALQEAERRAAIGPGAEACAFRTDVSPILAMARVRSGGAADPVACYRASGYRDRVASASGQGRRQQQRHRLSGGRSHEGPAPGAVPARLRRWRRPMRSPEQALPRRPAARGCPCLRAAMLSMSAAGAAPVISNHVADVAARLAAPPPMRAR